MDRPELEKLSSQELHDRAMERARHRMDLPFMWEVIRLLPAAHAAAGDMDTARADIQSLNSLIADFFHPDADEVDSLRPLYIEYLTRHTG